jgi:predicted PurR-regulated permease PerM
VRAPESRADIIVGLLAFLAVLAAAWALRASYVVTMPLVFAALLAMLVQPVNRAVADRLPEGWRWVGIVAAMAVLACCSWPRSAG